MSPLRLAMESQFNFVEFDSGYQFQNKSGKDYPYRLHYSCGKYILSQAFAPRVYTRPVFRIIKACETEDQALMVVIRRHNRACFARPDHKKIEVPKAFGDSIVDLS